MNKYDAADRKMGKILDALEADGYREADSVRDECQRSDTEYRPELANIVSQIDKLLRAIPKRYVPETDVRGSSTDSERGLYIELGWDNHRLYNTGIPSARFEVTFLGDDRVRYHGMIHDGKKTTHEVKLSEGKLLKKAISEAKRFFKKWPESPKVDVEIDENTPMGRLLAERGASITNLESLDRAVSDVYYAARNMECSPYVSISKTNVPEIDEFAAEFRKEYAKIVKRLSGKYRHAVLAELFPLARTVYQMYLARDPRTRMHDHMFMECAEAADADVCWKCGSFGEVSASKHKKYRKMCAKCSDLLVYA